MTTLYDDLLEGLTAMKEHLEGKRTLRTETLKRPEPSHNLTYKALPKPIQVY
ncbi:hypothetical protein PTQ27_05335 [Mannheimia sp. AT1]|uniref:Uncharacterized protein n=1 Tax=Mannheimia cairinae TaxID=3025936 RepID=A0ABT5MNY6_9PAST|nr:hypothetical protein [Mannheimia cairinae]MDD0823890.1 hypothetical protein [Mannheimia cairinae]MDD0825206.1 hypothetical protein [Mannheimia cairinae]